MERKEFEEKWSKLQKGYKYPPDDIIVYIGNDGNLIYANRYKCVQGNVKFFEDDEYTTEIGEFRLKDVKKIKLGYGD